MCEICDQLNLSTRPGLKPKTTNGTPHMQVEQTAPQDLWERLIRFGGELANVRLGPSGISLPDSIAMLVDDSIYKGGDPNAFMVPNEFAHVHGARDGSMHLCLPHQVLEQVYALGWGEPHPAAGKFGFAPTIAMVYAPRNETDFATVSELLKVSYDYATGALT